MFAVAENAVADVVTELTSFTGFRNRIDELVRELKLSEAGPKKVGDDAVLRAQFGGGDKSWAEADWLHTSYQTVITELETLSTLLSDSIEGMGIAVLASHNGYENLDIDIRQRMLAISRETTEHYGGPYDPTQAPAKQNADERDRQGDTPAETGDSSGAAGL
nr:hypothetical protein [uncultured Streptomyces sp.]